MFFMRGRRRAAKFGGLGVTSGLLADELASRGTDPSGSSAAKLQTLCLSRRGKNSLSSCASVLGKSSPIGRGGETTRGAGNFEAALLMPVLVLLAVGMGTGKKDPI